MTRHQSLDACVRRVEGLGQHFIRALVDDCIVWLSPESCEQFFVDFRREWRAMHGEGR